MASLGRADQIEIEEFLGDMYVPTEGDVATGKPRLQPITIVKRIDRTSPLLIKALLNNEPVNIARFRFFRPDPSGTGEEQHYYTIELTNGYIRGLRTYTESYESGGTIDYDEVTFDYQIITWTYEEGGITHSFDKSGST